MSKLLCDKCKKKCEEVWSVSSVYYPYNQFMKENKLELCEDCFKIMVIKLDKKISKQRINDEDV